MWAEIKKVWNYALCNVFTNYTTRSGQRKATKFNWEKTVQSYLRTNLKDIK